MRVNWNVPVLLLLVPMCAVGADEAENGGSQTAQPGQGVLAEALAQERLQLVRTGLTQEGAEDVQTTGKTSGRNITDTEGFEKFGFGPALYMIHYDEEIIGDATSDVRINSGSVVSADTTRSATHLGLEVHYTFKHGITANYKQDEEGNWVRDSSSGWSISPSVGLFDLDDGVSGHALGLVYSRWHGDADFTRQRALNIGASFITHRNRTVFVDGVDDGKALPAGYELADLTRKKDVDGLAIFVSYSLGF